MDRSSENDNIETPYSLFDGDANDVFTEQRTETTVIKNMTVDDCEFAAIMTVEAFRSKLEWAVGKHRLEDFTRLMTQSYQCSPEIYPRYFIAIYKENKAGLIALRLKNDPEPAEADYLDSYTTLGFCGFSGMLHVSGEMEYSVQDTKQCHIHHLTVIERFREQGISEALLNHAEQEGKRLDCTYMTLICNSLSPALQFYEDNGYDIGKTRGCCHGKSKSRWYKMVKQLPCE
ncbi:uncharacterized protein LOC144350870 [Saccoglossus kowalevskii]